jgi:transposase
MSTAAPQPQPLSPGTTPLPTAEQLPDDTQTLKQMIVELLVTLRQRDHDLEEARQRLDLLLRRLYGPRSERVAADQLLLFGLDSGTASDAASAPSAAAEAPADEPETSSAKQRHGKGHGRRRLPDDLPRRPLHHELSNTERICVCGEKRIDIGFENGGEQLDWQPASYFIWQHCIHKYLCPNCASKKLAADLTSADGASAGTPAAEPAAVAAATTTTAEPAESPVPSLPTTPPAAAAIGPVIVAAAKPPMPIDKGLPGAGLLAHIIVSKYFDHLPLYRQESISQREGVLIPRSTSGDWMAACAELLRPLYDLMVASVVQSRWLHTDDTPVKNLDHQPGTTDKARFWIYHGDRDHSYNVFDFTLNRQRDGPQTFLADFHGYLHADAFSGYDALYLPSPRAGSAPIQEVACNAHARRKFHEARGSDTLRAHQALAYYAQLYELERAARDFDDDQRRRLRQELAVPILTTFKAWLEEQRAEVLPKSSMAEAIGYALNNWSALVRYTEAGFLAIDNNVAEREMKRIAIGRKNWLFVGSANGGRTAAVLFSFTSTCHRLGIEPWAYLQDVLTRLPRTPPEHLAELLPDRWKAARPRAAATADDPSAPSEPLP